MPSYKERRQVNFANRLRVGASSIATAYTQFDAGGWQTQSGCARAYKEIFIRPIDFDVTLVASAAASVGAETACNAGSLYAGCVLFPITGSVFADYLTAGNVNIPALTMGVGASPASMLSAVALIPRPTDADTTGSIICYIDWTTGMTPATTGSKYQMQAAAGYLAANLGTPVAVRQSASIGNAASTASYSGTACGLLQTACLGKFPSFAACDTHLAFVLRLGASAAANSGGISTGCVFVLGVRLRYLSNVLGFQSIE